MGIRKSIARDLYRTITDRYDAHGKFYFEMWIRAPGSGKTWCDMLIHLVGPDPHKADDLLVGIEVKDWSDPVPRSVVLNELDGYRHSFDYFYFAANEFGPSALELEDTVELGLIELGDECEVIQSPRGMPTYAWDRKATIEALERNWNRNKEKLKHQYPDLFWIAERGGQKALAGFTEDAERGDSP